jgi:hypothetical protein
VYQVLTTAVLAGIFASPMQTIIVAALVVLLVVLLAFIIVTRIRRRDHGAA